MINNDRPRGRGLVMQSDALKAKIQLGGSEVALPDDITLDTMTQTLGVSKQASSTRRAIIARGADQEEEAAEVAERGNSWELAGHGGTERGLEYWAFCCSGSKWEARPALLLHACMGAVHTYNIPRQVRAW